ncbi:MAG: methyl-accepting chemotaxis protein [Treponema sp.]|nr:methyl-accepting chemotaxis protein [Treponema sp.]
MINHDINDKFRIDEHAGEKLICNVRIALAAILVAGTVGVAIDLHFRYAQIVPLRSHLVAGIFLLYALLLFFYVRRKERLSEKFKYICVVFDMMSISAIIWVDCTYPEISSPLPFLSFFALLYNVIIIMGFFRHSVKCAHFSGFFAAITYLVAVFANIDVLDVSLYDPLNEDSPAVIFSVYYEIFRVVGMIVTGIITGMANKRRIALFSSVIEAERAIANSELRVMDQTRSMARTIQKSTDEIFLSSKEIFSTANDQAASVHEIKSTLSENTKIAVTIAEKTGSVANIASQMKDDVIDGFSILESNVKQMEGIRTKNDGVISGIVALGNKITKINEINKMINTVTDQTKVIAFNAALESASAGERGKRFAAVANEVDRLADDIAALTKKIKEQLKEIQDSSTALIFSSEESADKIAEGNNLIKKLEDIFREIRSGAEITANQAQMITISTQKQLKSSEQIDIAMSDISSGLGSFLRSTEVATGSAEELTRMIEELGDLLEAK